MPVAVFLIALSALVYFDPAGYYHEEPYRPPTPVEQLRTEWWAANMAADISADNKTHDDYLAEQRKLIIQKATTHGINPNEVFNG